MYKTFIPPFEGSFDVIGLSCKGVGVGFMPSLSLHNCQI